MQDPAYHTQYNSAMDDPKMNDGGSKTPVIKAGRNNKDANKAGFHQAISNLFALDTQNASNGHKPVVRNSDKNVVSLTIKGANNGSSKHITKHTRLNANA